MEIIQIVLGPNNLVLGLNEVDNKIYMWEYTTGSWSPYWEQDQGKVVDVLFG